LGHEADPGGISLGDRTALCSTLGSMSEPSSPAQKVGLAGWIAIVVLGGFLIASIGYAFHAWSRMAGTDISGFGWVMLGLGVFFTLACGVILMGLVFYSSRKNFDR